MRDHWDEYWTLYVFAVLPLLIIAAVIPFAIRDQNRWEQWCTDQGGHVTDHTESTVSTVVGANGQPGVAVGTSTTYYCLSADGRILDIQ